MHFEKKRKKRKENATSPGCIFLPSSVSSSSSSLCLRSFSLNLSPYLPFLSSYSVPLRHSFNTDVWCNETKRERQLFPLTLFPLRPVSLPSFISYIFLFHPLFFSFFPFCFHVACSPTISSYSPHLSSSCSLLSRVLFFPSVSLTRFIFSSNYSIHTHTHTQSLCQWCRLPLQFYFSTSQGHCGTVKSKKR